jgi:hypothetical protein
VGVDPGVGVGLSAVIAAVVGLDDTDGVPASALASLRIPGERGASEINGSAL